MNSVVSTASPTTSAPLPRAGRLKANAIKRRPPLVRHGLTSSGLHRHGGGNPADEEHTFTVMCV